METITINLVNGLKYGEFAVLYKLGRKQIGWTQRTKNGEWCNFGSGYMFSASETLERAIWVMEEYLCRVLDPLNNKRIIFNKPQK